MHKSPEQPLLDRVTPPVPDAGESNQTRRLPRRLVLMLGGAALVGSLVASSRRTMAALRDDRPEDLYAALRNQPHTRIAVARGDIDIVFADGAAGLDHGRVIAWIKTSADAVATYFGRFPVDHVGVLVRAAGGDRLGSAVTYGLDGSAIEVHVGRSTDAAAFRNDWILVHEMTHLALPTVPRRSLWLQEGNATYVEPIARAQAGQIAATEVWHWALEGMPKGLPQAGDEGLDNTATWGRTYWGGALFWLLADVRIREQTHGRFGVQDALVAVNRTSGGNTARWSVDQVVMAGDQATGTSVLTTLYAQMKAQPSPVDLPALFKQLGVSEQQGDIVFDDHAPLADIRRQITTPPSPKLPI